MKRFVIGCLSVFVVLLIAGGIAAYIFLWRPARALVNSAQQIQQIQRLDDRVENRARFTPPADGVLSEGDVERYFLVQEAMRTDLEGRLEELNEKYDEFQTADGRPRIRQILNAYADLFGLVRDAKEAQVAALNAQGFSLAEYGWVKQEVLAASGLAIQGFDLGALAEAARSGEELEAPTVAREVPQANLDLVEPYRDRFEELIGLAYFGL